jgi:hypothetical protein
MSIKYHSPHDFIWEKRGVIEALLKQKKDCYTTWRGEIFICGDGRVGKLSDVYKEIEITMADKRKFSGDGEYTVPCLEEDEEKEIFREKARAAGREETYFGFVKYRVVLYDSKFDEFNFLSEDFEQAPVQFKHSPFLGGIPGKCVYVDEASQTITMRDEIGGRVTLRSLGSFDEKEQSEYKIVDDSQSFAWVTVASRHQLDVETEILFELWYQTRNLEKSEEFEYVDRPGKIYSLTRLKGEVFIQRDSEGNEDLIERIKRKQIRIRRGRG